MEQFYGFYLIMGRWEGSYIKVPKMRNWHYNLYPMRKLHFGISIADTLVLVLLTFA